MRVPGTDNIFRMTTQYTIVGGTGKFANGEVDLGRGQLAKERS